MYRNTGFTYRNISQYAFWSMVAPLLVTMGDIIYVKNKGNVFPYQDVQKVRMIFMVILWDIIEGFYIVKSHNSKEPSAHPDKVLLFKGLHQYVIMLKIKQVNP